MPAIGLLILLAAAPSRAAFPGVPGPIAYSKVDASELTFTGGLFAHGPRKRDGSHRLTDDAEDGSPSYSPNGRLVVFSGNREAGEPRGSHVYVMKRDGTDVRQLTSGSFVDSNPSFSPDGQSVVFDRSGSSGGASKIFGVSIDGSGLHPITDGPARDYEPVFTPNGRRIVFVSNRVSSGRRDRSNIFSMRPDGSQVRILIGGPRNEFEPDVSPSGRRLVFTSNREPGLNLFLARMSGKHVRALTRTPGGCFHRACFGNPAWSPDGKHIAFLSSSTYSTGIEVLRADGRGVAKEFDGGGTEEEGFGTYVGAPTWGPKPR